MITATTAELGLQYHFINYHLHKIARVIGSSKVQYIMRGFGMVLPGQATRLKYCLVNRLKNREYIFDYLRFFIASIFIEVLSSPGVNW